MSEQDPAERDAPKSEADRTLLGVAPPRVDSSAGSPLRSPVFVRSGTSVADVEAAPLPALPSRQPSVPGATPNAPLAQEPSPLARVRAGLEPALGSARAHPVLGMVVLPVLLALCLLAATGHRAPHTRPLAAASSAAGPQALAPSASSASAQPTAAELAELERRPAGSLSARELVLLAEGRAEQKRSAASALRQKLERNPALGKDSAQQAELLQLAADESTAPQALSAMALLEPPLGADLLYEVWTATSVRSDTTELARALLYSTDVRSKASPALAVALDLRLAERCEQYQAILPRALADGDRRAQHLLLKLNGKHGCGPKKSDDCYACLRDKRDELKATLNAVKSRRPPSFTAP
jgi:hypothetical protein